MGSLHFRQADTYWDHEPMCLLSRRAGTLSSIPNGGEGWGEEERFMGSRHARRSGVSCWLEPFREDGPNSPPRIASRARGVARGSACGTAAAEDGRAPGAASCAAEGGGWVRGRAPVHGRHE
jgi:hypothetical protein